MICVRITIDIPVPSTGSYANWLSVPMTRAIYQWKFTFSFTAPLRTELLQYFLPAWWWRWVGSVAHDKRPIIRRLLQHDEIAKWTPSMQTEHNRTRGWGAGPWEPVKTGSTDRSVSLHVWASTTSTTTTTVVGVLAVELPDQVNSVHLPRQPQHSSYHRLLATMLSPSLGYCSLRGRLATHALPPDYAQICFHNCVLVGVLPGLFFLSGKWVLVT